MKLNKKTDVAPVSGQHTPTPWEACESWPFPDGGGRRYSAVIKRFQRFGYKDEALICSFEHSVFRDNATANVEFIVRACNCHDELVAACKSILLCDTPTEDMGGDWGTVEWAEQVGNAIESARAALNKASR